MWEKQNLTQEQLASKCGTTKSYISRIENNASDIRLSTLMRIVKDGLGGKLLLTVAFKKIMYSHHDGFPIYFTLLSFLKVGLTPHTQTAFPDHLKF
jgi:transcriptional regulator with XRE-family HTH domain